VNGVNHCLARAAKDGLTEITKCLLEAGADPNRPDEVTFLFFFTISYLAA
jgi:ankyrin repeat protein